MIRKPSWGILRARVRVELVAPERNDQPQHAKEPDKSALARDSEEEAPVPSETLQRICKNGMSVDLSSVTTENSASYRRYLNGLHCPKRHAIYEILDMGPMPFSILLVLIVVSGLWAGYQYQQCGWPFKDDCETVVVERKSTFQSKENGGSGVQQINERGFVQTRPEGSILRTERVHDRGILNLATATVLGALIAFFYANFQWRMGNRQASINEFFQRKKDINLLLLSNEAIRSFLKEAVDRRSLKDRTPKKLTPAESKEVLEKIQHRSYLLEIERFSFDQKMFVFLEIDNLEFALEKYSSGYLDHGQMYRACEIFQSRCYNRGFRYLAATQGLVYYKDELKKILASMIVRGNYYEEQPTRQPGVSA